MHRGCASNACDVKYFVHGYSCEYARVEGIGHGSFDELRRGVEAHCPTGLRCVQPMTLLCEMAGRTQRDAPPTDECLLLGRDAYAHVDWLHTHSVCVQATIRQPRAADPKR